MGIILIGTSCSFTRLKYHHCNLLQLQIGNSLKQFFSVVQYLYDILVANPCFSRNVWGVQRSHCSQQSAHGKSQNFLKYNVSCKSIWVIQAHSKSQWVCNSAESNIQLAMCEHMIGSMITSLLTVDPLTVDCQSTVNSADHRSPQC